jgi:hypothetical protein
MAKGLTPRAEFLAVDLDVRSRKSLAALFAAWPDADTPGYTGKAPRWIHTQSLLGKNGTADQEIQDLLKTIARLPPAARRCWNEATSRTFDIGIQAGLGPHSFQEVLVRPATIEAVARAGGRILITLYAPHRD